MDFKDIQPGVEVSHVVRGGKFEIIGFEEGSQTRVIIKDIDRGPGWDEASRSYKGVNVEHGWYRGENFAYGQEDVCHRKDLLPYKYEQ